MQDQAAGHRSTWFHNTPIVKYLAVKVVFEKSAKAVTCLGALSLVEMQLTLD